MDATLPVDLRRFRPVLETSFRKIQQEMEQDNSSYVVANKLSAPLAAAADDSNVAVRTEQQRSLKFSVENILDPTKFTGHSPLPAPRINNNIFHQQQHLFNPAHHPWLLPANLLHHHQQQQQVLHHHMDVHSTSVESEDSLYDRSSDLESGASFSLKHFSNG